ncbi:MAG: arginine--tRNA ligase [Candidatus Muproteobacteria bacterium RIFCSPHIGHO2_12_FULL_60_33]|uniref:Arginine--tRNA ligase n=1 Tax=Candidatus Muproteobacteria bacterium RIFCSPLOWO2_01_FULL_60_18 TaxID=1817768 RepID=A0A1F6U525_9PROT|nr:MAG: arginine--tRNA ligase [Candidatus Muproteobacteria bacterium RIFCSPLOWO2_01_FULL_60_18]OGI53723.1 MAG: arginine--tRNA ligase [Candidatus Muproteobacteria bacterium RIFCSPHIGHO2_02_FULL_60_13]OGI54396.1 MAG: arginine--tRNA ligase [Candidatus Muproteobacteria bacterium RIFCSPHIGHO2_12_FULL_60_33]OGI57699.1 MAG: arginine--tRNA ligase [Candidatus Muproteobacteria bacterium RIFCSPHIGHO2_01_FULL_61_200]
MKHHIENLIASALAGLEATGALPLNHGATITIDHTKTKGHGDFACNIALVLAKHARVKPRELAEKIVKALPASEKIVKVEIAGPGFINFFLSADAYHTVVREILEKRETFGRSQMGAGRKVQVEFVSANPTGPLHVGHGRGAAYGATLANLLDAVGFQVHREYYINDAGRQMDILATSVWLRYLELCGERFDFPVNGYKGDYVYDIGATLHRENGDKYRHASAKIFENIPPDEPQGGDKETHIDALIERAKSLLGTAAYRKVFDLGLQVILDDIRQDLEEFGVTYDQWFSERSLIEPGDTQGSASVAGDRTSGATAAERAIERLKKSGHVYEKEGALWFRSTDYGDEKDRVVVRENGQKTYFAHDIAYHMDKLERGYDQVIDIWGADHHGYVPRVKAALAAIGDDPERLHVLLVQFAILYKGGERMQMSTRSGEFVTLRELRREVGNDAARFFYVLRRCEQHMDFDLDLAKSQSNDNPVFYVQYAHARIYSVFRQMKEKGFRHDPANGDRHLARLTEPHELALIQRLARYPEVLEAAAQVHEPHQLAYYLRELAYDFHTYYGAHTFLVEDAAVRDARLNLIVATRQVIANGLKLLGVSAPESM